MEVDKQLEHNCPDIIVIDKEGHTAQIIDITVPFDTNIVDKTTEKITVIVIWKSHSKRTGISVTNPLTSRKSLE
eukprot:15334676-Ditylum_brightwellii.AAC.1